MNRRNFVGALGASIATSMWAPAAVAKTAFLSTAERGQNNPTSRYLPNWTSLKQHIVPQWFDDAKLGIFIHYGLYSVPAWAPTVKLTSRGEIDWGKFRPDMSDWFTNDPYAEWYMNTLRIKGSPTWKHHIETYGENFDYLDFIPNFNREVKKWDPDQWAELFKDIGARYIVPTTRHHDGFRLWPSEVHNPHRKPDQQGTQRDIIGELAAAVRKQGIHMGIYFSGGLDWSFTETPILTQQGLNDHIPQSEEYGQYCYALLEELIHRYEPDDIWNDIAYPRTCGMYSNFLPTITTLFQTPRSMTVSKWLTNDPKNTRVPRCLDTQITHLLKEFGPTRLSRKSGNPATHSGLHLVITKTKGPATCFRRAN